MIRWNVIRLRETGQRVTYEYQSKWNRIYYSFDNWRTQATSKTEAYRVADKSLLHVLEG